MPKLKNLARYRNRRVDAPAERKEKMGGFSLDVNADLVASRTSRQRAQLADAEEAQDTPRWVEGPPKAKRQREDRLGDRDRIAVQGLVKKHGTENFKAMKMDIKLNVMQYDERTLQRLVKTYLAEEAEDKEDGIPPAKTR